MSPMLADQTALLVLIFALPFLAILSVPAAIIVFNITLWLRDLRRKP